MHWFDRRHHAGRITRSCRTLDQLSPLPLSLSSPTAHLLRFLVPLGSFRKHSFGDGLLGMPPFISLISKCPFYRPGLWKCTLCISQLTKYSFLQPFLPFSFFASVFHIHVTLDSLQKAASLTGKPCCPGFPLSPSRPS